MVAVLDQPPRETGPPTPSALTTCSSVARHARQRRASDGERTSGLSRQLPVPTPTNMMHHQGQHHRINWACRIPPASRRPDLLGSRCKAQRPWKRLLTLPPQKGEKKNKEDKRTSLRAEKHEVGLTWCARAGMRPRGPGGFQGRPTGVCLGVVSGAGRSAPFGARSAPKIQCWAWEPQGVSGNLNAVVDNANL